MEKLEEIHTAGTGGHSDHHRPPPPSNIYFQLGGQSHQQVPSLNAETLTQAVSSGVVHGVTQVSAELTATIILSGITGVIKGGSWLFHQLHGGNKEKCSQEELITVILQQQQKIEEQEKQLASYALLDKKAAAAG